MKSPELQHQYFQEVAECECSNHGNHRDNESIGLRRLEELLYLWMFLNYEFAPSGMGLLAPNHTKFLLASFLKGIELI